MPIFFFSYNIGDSLLDHSMNRNFFYYLYYYYYFLSFLNSKVHRISLKTMWGWACPVLDDCEGLGTKLINFKSHLHSTLL